MVADIEANYAASPSYLSFFLLVEGVTHHVQFTYLMLGLKGNHRTEQVPFECLERESIGEEEAGR